MRFSWLAVLCLWVIPTASARDYRIDDLLRLESYGQVVVDPGGRWAIVERRDRYDSASRYSYDWMVRRLLSKLLVVDLFHGGRARPLFAQDKDAGYWSGGFSPSGKRLAIFRLADNQLQAGVVEMATRKVRWLALVPDLPNARPAPIWVDDDHLLFVTLDDGGLPGLLQTPTNAQRAANLGWSKAARGRKPSSDLLGSGRYLQAGSTYRPRRVVQIDLATGKKHIIFQGDVLDMALSGDRNRIALLTKGPAVQPDARLPIDPAFEPRRQRLTIVDLASRARQSPCPGCDVLPSLLRWAPTGARLLYYARKDGTAWSEGQLYRTDSSSGVTTTPLPAGIRAVTQIGGGSARFVRAGWAGNRAIAFAECSGTGRRDWYVLETGGIVHAITGAMASAPDDLASVDRDGFFAGDDRGLWRGNWDGSLARVDPAPVSGVRPILFDGHSVGTRDWLNMLPERLFAVAGTSDRPKAIVADASGTLHALPVPVGADVLAFTPTGDILAYGEDARGVGALLVVGVGKQRVVDRINLHLADVEPARRVLLHSRAADGKLLNHWLLLPAARSSRLPRLVVVPYPGYPYGTTAPWDSKPTSPTTMTHPLLLVGRGYAVLQPSIPLADAPGEPLPAIAAELLKAVDAAQDSGLVSKAKPFLVGHSYGGYAVLGMASLSDRFAGVVAADGVYDLASIYGAMDPRINYAEDGFSLTIPIGWAEGGQGRMGVPPWTAIARYARNSPFYHVENISVPVLLVTSDLDYVPDDQAERMFLALYRKGKDAMLLRYRGESHSLISPANLRDYWSHLFAFLGANQHAEPGNPQ